MKTTGRYSKFEDTKPEDTFLSDLREDIKTMDSQFIKSVARDVKIKLINELLNSL